MVNTYYTLRALVAEWDPGLRRHVLQDAFSQTKDELTLALATPDAASMLRLSVQAPFHFVFRSDGYSRARRNVATLFEAAFGRAVTGLRLADRDRVLYLDLDGGLTFQALLFGPRANVFLTDGDGFVLEAFQADADWSGQPAPPARPAPAVATFEAFEARWRADRKHTLQALSSALPLFDATLAAEVMHRAGVATPKPGACTPAERRALFDAAQALEAELATPSPHIYWRGRFADVFSLVPLRHLEGRRAEAFDSVDAAVRVFVRRTLGERHFRQHYEPLEKALDAAAQHYRQGAERMLEELARESRADRYEHWGHLLMASPGAAAPGDDAVALPDLFAPEADAPVHIPLDPALSAVENAQRYYDRARRTRRAREEAEGRLVQTEARALAAEALLERLRRLDTLADLETFRKDEADRLAPFLGGATAEEDRLPFRRYALPGGYEVWVGRNAKQNDLLTFRYARKHDLWLHARGVAGSHALLRLPGRQSVPPRAVLEGAAAVAAYHSKARGSALVPVMVAPRKYVRKPKGAAPGAVVVEREDVLLVEPGVPG